MISAPVHIKQVIHLLSMKCVFIQAASRVWGPLLLLKLLIQIESVNLHPYVFPVSEGIIEP